MSKYFNTTRIDDKLLEAGLAATRTQEEYILLLWRVRQRAFTPSEMTTMCSGYGKTWPMTSVRRAISNLTDEGFLVRLDRQKIGIYGRPEHFWRLAA